MKHRITYFTLFLSLVLGLIVGVYRYSFITQLMYYLLFFVIVLFSYRLYLLFEKLGVFLYETYFKKIIIEIKKTKNQIEEE